MSTLEIDKHPVLGALDDIALRLKHPGATVRMRVTARDRDSGAITGMTRSEIPDTRESLLEEAATLLRGFIPSSELEALALASIGADLAAASGQPQVAATLRKQLRDAGVRERQGPAPGPPTRFIVEGHGRRTS